MKLYGPSVKSCLASTQVFAAFDDCVKFWSLFQFIFFAQNKLVGNPWSSVKENHNNIKHKLDHVKYILTMLFKIRSLIRSHTDLTTGTESRVQSGVAKRLLKSRHNMTKDRRPPVSPKVQEPRGRGWGSTRLIAIFLVSWKRRY